MSVRALLAALLPSLLGLAGCDPASQLDRGESYCRRPEAEPPPQPYCTRSLGTVDCWARPYAMRDLPPQVADGPRVLTPAQEHDRLSGWLNL